MIYKNVRTMKWKYAVKTTWNANNHNIMEQKYECEHDIEKCNVVLNNTNQYKKQNKCCVYLRSKKSY